MQGDSREVCSSSSASKCLGAGKDGKVHFFHCAAEGQHAKGLLNCSKFCRQLEHFDRRGAGVQHSSRQSLSGSVHLLLIRYSNRIRCPLDSTSADEGDCW